MAKNKLASKFYPTKQKIAKTAQKYLQAGGHQISAEEELKKIRQPSWQAVARVFSPYIAHHLMSGFKFDAGYRDADYDNDEIELPTSADELVAPTLEVAVEIRPHGRKPMTEANETKAAPASAPKGENKPAERAEMHHILDKPHKVMRCLCSDGVRRNATLKPSKKSAEGHISGMVRVQDKKVYGFVLQVGEDYKFVASKEAKNAGLLPS